VTKTIQEQLLENRHTYARTIEALREDWTISEEHRNQQMAEAFSTASSSHADLIRQYRTGLEEDYAKAERKMFSAPALGGERALDILAYRDALDRTAKTAAEDAAELRRMAEDAMLVGDSSLAHACLLRGWRHPQEAVAQGLVDAYFDHHPDEAGLWSHLMGTAELLNHLNAVGPELAVGVPAPEEPQEISTATQTRFGGAMAKGISDLRATLEQAQQQPGEAMATSEQPPQQSTE
jgi:hypothetical protein